jgi:hypothetical protein
MARAIIAHPQSRANLLRELLATDPAIRRTGTRVQGVEGAEDRLMLQVVHGDRKLRLVRGPEWRSIPLSRLQQSLKGQLLSRTTAGPGWHRPDRSGRYGTNLRLSPLPGPAPRFGRRGARRRPG